MIINNELSITCSSTTQFIALTYKGITMNITPEDQFYAEAKRFYNKMRSISVDNRANAITDGLISLPSFLKTDEPTTETVVEETRDSKTILLDGLEKLINFFSEFEFTPSYRFTNTFAFKASINQKSAKEFVNNYFSLTSSAYADDIAQKIKSKEFNEIIKSISQYGKPAQNINNRFKIYYGAAGTGKTTLAQTETNNRCIVCNASMLPSDLMENFIFRDGKPDFDPSILWDCMEQGKPIVLDEINLLPFDSLRFLQGIVDGKTTFSYKNRTVHINDGFKIIGTMNLTLGGVTYGLPEPLVDRCEDIREFVLSANQLMGAITGEFEQG